VERELKDDMAVCEGVDVDVEVYVSVHFDSFGVS
jgi:hypothetical protein